MDADWKVERDLFYAPLAERFGLDWIEEAGFFFDTAKSHQTLSDVRTLCTPTTFITKALAERSVIKPAVLVCTGSFSPVHDGHIAMMNAAKTAATHAGYDVLGGYLSPGHDDYIQLKLRQDATSTSVRLDQCSSAVVVKTNTDSDWLMVDPWESLHRTTSVNFTDVLIRLGRYLGHHVDGLEEPAIFYVCGGDNARFALTFVERGYCVVVGRPGAEPAFEHYRAHSLLRDNPRVLWAECSNSASSTKTRRQKREVMRVSPATSSLPAPPTTGLTTSPTTSPTTRPTLSLRCEGAHVLWNRGVAAAHFQNGLEALLSEWSRITRTAPEQQRLPERAHPVISLDPMTPADYTLEISRLFDLGGTTRRGHIARPDALPLAAQARTFPPGTYTLFDDDVFTGGTLRAALSLMPKEVTIADAQTFETLAGSSHRPNEIADSRDFLLGATAGGLVVRAPDGQLCRAPYLLPYVDPAIRCTVAANATRRFSAAAWSLGESFFQDSHLTLQDLPPPSHRLMAAAGFVASDSLEEICRWHAELCS